MALVEFKDLPDTTTPINAENLNNNFDDFFYKDGESFVLTDYFAMAGHLTGGRRTMDFTLITPKSMKNIKRITVGDLYINIRKPAGGYIAQNANFNSSDYTLELLKTSDNSIRIIITSKNSDLDTINNQPLSGHLPTGTTFTFHKV